MPLPRQHLHPTLTTWYITWGTYGARLHGSSRPTVDREHNERGEPFLPRDSEREAANSAVMCFPPRYFTGEQCSVAEACIPEICVRGGWELRVCSAAADHVHVLCDVEPAIHGEKVRRLLKRWLGQELAKRWPLEPKQTFWAEEGSNIAIHDEDYLNNAFRYIFRQRETPVE